MPKPDYKRIQELEIELGLEPPPPAAWNSHPLSIEEWNDIMDSTMGPVGNPTGNTRNRVEEPVEAPSVASEP